MYFRSADRRFWGLEMIGRMPALQLMDWHFVFFPKVGKSAPADFDSFDNSLHLMNVC